MLYQCVFESDAGESYHAFVYAKTEDNLFWAVDEFFDPYGCKIYPVVLNRLSFCTKATRETDNDDGKPFSFLAFDELQLSERLLNAIDDNIEKESHFYFAKIEGIPKLVKSKKIKG